MAYDRFLIAPLNEGQVRGLKPWMIPDNAFEFLRNAYVYRGYVRKRFGSSPLNMDSALHNVVMNNTRLRVFLGNTNVAGNVAGNVATITGALAANICKVGQQFTIGNDTFTVFNPAAGPQNMLSTSPTAIVFTYDVTTGAFNIVGADVGGIATPCYWYPSYPVMGFAQYEGTPINDERVYAFDQNFAYQRTGGGWDRLTAETVPGDAIWTGNNAQFFWHTNYRGANADDYQLFVTNYNAADHIRYRNGTIWTTLRPAYIAAANSFIETARIILPFKDRLLLLNTVESVGGVNHTYRNRCRFCANGSPFAANAWREDIPGQGDFIDAPTREAIVSAAFLKDRLIVYFERSTWEIVYTGNHVLPFVWQQINAELGCESTFSVVNFDKAILGIANVGIHACTGANVERIDAKIPDDVFAFHNNNDGVYRVQGIRDYVAECVYWSIPAFRGAGTYPNRILVYNYNTNSWAYNDDSITAFGYWQDQNDVAWQDMRVQWQQVAVSWDTGLFEAQYRSIIAGNQQGFTFNLGTGFTNNAPSLQISSMALDGITANIVLEIFDHNLLDADYIIIEGVIGATTTVLNDNIYRVARVSADLILLEETAGLGINVANYEGAGTVARVSQIQIQTKQYNFYLKNASNIYLAKVDFNVDRTANGEISVFASASSSNETTSGQGLGSGTALGNYILLTRPYPTVPFEATQDRLWHTVFYQCEGECVQLYLFLSAAQMRDPNIVFSDFQLNAFMLHTMQTNEY